MKKRYYLLLFTTYLSFLIGTQNVSAGVSDTIHVSHYNITIDTINFSAHTLRGSTLLSIQSKLNQVHNITLNLLQLQIDSIKSRNQKLNFTYVASTDIHISAPAALNTGDTLSLRVFYHGSPKQDASWGGFIFSGSYAFNMGVGFAADPHSFGKVWFPCVDEFTDRSTYEFFINTSASNKAFCNGTLQSVVSNPNGTKTWHWELKQPIPAYLASIAVAPFYTLKKTYNGIPVEWAIMPTDSIKTKNTFANFGSALSCFTNSYGPYRFDKAGYVAIPFNYGAMEHATSIHIGKAFIDGTLNYETLWAHELSHHWWGDLVTCETEGDMWLNEGFASFNESLFLENLYGKTSYKNNIRSVNRYVLQFAHIDDGGYLSLENVPHLYTYGTTVYQKGAMVAHTLRNYMGDAKFFQGCKDYMNNKAFANANSNDLRNELATSSGNNLNNFFTDWISTPGFPHFSIDSTRITPNGNLYDVKIFTKQKQKGNTHMYNMLVECNFTNGIKDTNVVFTIDSAVNSYHVQLPFLPNWISIDRDDKMSDAISDYEKTISTLGSQAFPETNASLNVLNKGNSNSTVRIEHHWVAPDDFIGQNPGIKLSDYHYYSVDGIFTPSFLAKATFIYDGSFSTTGYIDNTLIPSNGREDSLVILYRKGAGYNWQMVKGYTLNKGVSSLDKKGTFTIDTLKKGEYVFGYHDISLSSKNQAENISEKNYQLSISPNPVKEKCTIHFTIPVQEKGIIHITDMLGKEIFQTAVYAHQNFITWDTWQKNAGMYIVSLEVNQKKVKTEKIILEK